MVLFCSFMSVSMPATHKSLTRKVRNSILVVASLVNGDIFHDLYKQFQRLASLFEKTAYSLATPFTENFTGRLFSVTINSVRTNKTILANSSRANYHCVPSHHQGVIYQKR